MLPDPLSVSVGTEVTRKGRTYVKASSGRWSLLIDDAMLKLIYKTYVDDRRTLRETKALVNTPGLPGANIQKILEEQGWMRSHYGRNDKRDAWYRKNYKGIIRAHHHGIDLVTIERWSGVQVGVRLMAHGFKQRRSGRTLTAETATTNGWLVENEFQEWNSLLETDVDVISFQTYRSVVHRLTNLVLKRMKIRRSAGDHVDHKLSRYFGYHTQDSNPVHGRNQSNVKREQVVPLAFMCHPENLRIVKATVNCHKRFDSILTVKELCTRVRASDLRLEKLNYHEELDKMLRSFNIVPYAEA